MLLTFCGAAHEVTGSCYYIEACGKKFLVDYGLEQGADVYPSGELPVAPGELDYVFLTHAHIDHSGKLPLLASAGFKGRIICTGATKSLCDIMLRDSAHIQETETEWKNRKGKRAGREEIKAIYTVDDAVEIMKYFEGHDYNETINVSDGIQAKFIDAGHLLGSASIELTLTENGITKTVVFSGDIGNTEQPLIRDPQYLHKADYVIMESTYGDREHEAHPDYEKELAAVIGRTLSRGGNLVIPSFAVGRTQEMLYFIRMIKEENLLPALGDFKVYVDSPLAVEATAIYDDRVNTGYFDPEALELLRKGIDPIKFSNLCLSISSDQSQAINFDKEPSVIISASGMCDAGRIKHHLKHNLWRQECTVLFVGYQAAGTLGRSLVDGATHVKIFGEEIEVRSEVTSLPGVSGHADINGLIKWISAFDEKPDRVFVCHGEDTVCESFANKISNELGENSFAPYPYAKADLITGELLSQGNSKKIEKPDHANGNISPNSPYGRLLTAMQSLQSVVAKSNGGTNKDVAALTDQIISLCKKWDR